MADDLALADADNVDEFSLPSTNPPDSHLTSLVNDGGELMDSPIEQEKEMPPTPEHTPEDYLPEESLVTDAPPPVQSLPAEQLSVAEVSSSTDHTPVSEQAPAIEDPFITEYTAPTQSEPGMSATDDTFGTEVSLSQDVITPSAEDVPTMDKLLPTDDSQMADLLPHTEDVLRTEDMPHTEDVSHTEDMPQTEDMPRTEDMSQTVDMPHTEDMPRTEEMPQTEDMPPTEEMPPTEDMPQTEDLPHTEDVKPAEDLPHTDSMSAAEQEPDLMANTEESSLIDYLPPTSSQSEVTSSITSHADVDGANYDNAAFAQEPEQPILMTSSQEELYRNMAADGADKGW